jgi:hypothetical protein
MTGKSESIIRIKERLKNMKESYMISLTKMAKSDIIHVYNIFIINQFKFSFI